MDSSNFVDNLRASLPDLTTPSLDSEMPPAESDDGTEASLRAELALVKKELAEMKAMAKLGDYAGGVFNFLKHVARTDARMKGLATTFADGLRLWETSDHHSEHAR
ncbi:hypothetical protein PV08_01592 [Exophiala spinifera]|uniref:Uncharacterized protein n=1 Tax=Exophiala spinifera TaxID=91928 RepID=A0A0D2BQ11_9EURO|nr:uncharacterized protein PV08_01592 [Exophiala spinifera]KIW21013.1 hypothetical protein PV08_01592 [Exophiala spinifera]